MKKLNLAIANLLFILHCLLGIFFLTGWMFPEIKILYRTSLALWIGSWIFLGYCPVSKWEFTLRSKYDKSIDPYAELIKYYIHKIFKKDVPSQRIFTIGIVVFIILVLLTLTK